MAQARRKNGQFEKVQIPESVIKIYLNLRSRGFPRNTACQICSLNECNVRLFEKTDPRFAGCAEAEQRGRATIIGLVCQKAAEALENPHGRNAVHWANWLLRSLKAPLPQIGVDPVEAQIDGRTVVNVLNVFRDMDARKVKTIENETIPVITHDERPELVRIGPGNSPAVAG